MNFTHLHVHSHYSILDGMSKIPDLVDKCMRNGMRSMALTDHGSMFGIKEFVDYASKINRTAEGQVAKLEKELETAEDAKKEAIHKEIVNQKERFFKPIIGVEAYCAHTNLSDKKVKEDGSGYHLILLAKNEIGYYNLCTLVSTSWIDGYYYRPRIDKALLEKHHEGLIVCSACLGGEIPQHIMKGNMAAAESAIHWFKNIFGDDYYLEMQRHQTDKPGGDQTTFQKQKEVNEVLVELAHKTNTKLIATNDVHFVEEEHGEAHDRLICLNTGKDLDDVNRMHYTKQEWLKSPEEMSAIFADMPEVLETTQEIVDKIEIFSLNSDPIMPKFDIPVEFGTEEAYRKKQTDEDLFKEFTCNEKGEVTLSQEEAEKKIGKLGGYEKLVRIKLEADYLAQLAWEGAHKRYGETLSDELIERIVFELHIMKTMGFPGYFLIVHDYIRAAREELGVSVGPGRGSAAGSVVAYCLKITDIDPLKYDLLFERFLNPDRISMPDIDVDFDDDGRGAVIDWVTKKYGKEKVAHIITYGTMATKSSIKDVGRVQKVPLAQVNQLTGLIPDKFSDQLADPITKKVPKVNIKNCLKYVPELKNAVEGDDSNISSMLTYAEELEDTVRQVGIHACGIIIGADNLTKFAPLATVKDRATNEDVLVTQYDGHVVESVGLIKMDFLGLKTLSIIKEALSNIKKSHGIDINIDTIPIDDKKTYKLYAEGKTVGTFQFESTGMQKYLRELKPTVFEDLIAMNALYRPGPMDYIPQFIARKQGREEIMYDIPIMETYLKETYGITVYQEQVMLLSRLLAGFTRGESDALRKAMGKKIISVLNELKPKFLAGGKKNGYTETVLDKIWRDWEKFASYAFNKSHATCYSWISYQTAYLKAHYPAEFMAANLTRNRDNITDVTKFMDECKAMRLSVKGPDVNESDLNFTVNKVGDIRFGLGGIKGVGEGAVEAIVQERKTKGPYTSVYDFVERVNLSSCNRKALESLALSGAFDAFEEMKREQFFVINTKGEQTIDALIRYGNRFQQDKALTQNSLFGGLDTVEIAKPEIPTASEWSSLERLNKEKELIGIYLSSHPLDRYRIALEYGCSKQMSDMKDLKDGEKNRIFTVGGMVVAAREGVTKNNRPYGILTIEDYSGQFEFALFGKDFVDFGKFLKKDLFVLIKVKVQERGSDWKKYPKEETPNALKEWELKITSIDMLEDTYESLIQKVTIVLPLVHVNKLNNSEIISLVEANPGRTDLYIQISDIESSAMVTLRSKKHKIDVSTAFIDGLKELELQELLEFKING
ncbi:MAG TPA: DNA polymerase III subunit alpha [Paludibacteraceae bacterium]|nr:DNA polymerase III subunit alpha [Paludibacteraceae bacterium]